MIHMIRSMNSNMILSESSLVIRSFLVAFCLYLFYSYCWLRLEKVSYVAKAVCHAATVGSQAWEVVVSWYISPITF